MRRSMRWRERDQQTGRRERWHGFICLLAFILIHWSNPPLTHTHPPPTPHPPLFWACVNVLEALNGRWNFQWIACKSINCKDHYLVSMRLNQLSHSIPHLHTKCFILAINESAPLYVWLITCLQEMDSLAISLNSVDAEQFETWRRQQWHLKMPQLNYILQTFGLFVLGDKVPPIQS